MPLEEEEVDLDDDEGAAGLSCYAKNGCDFNY